MKDVRLNLTENEKIAIEAVGLKGEVKNFHMGEKSINDLIQKEKANAFNSQVDSFIENLEAHNNDYNEARSEIDYDINLAEIKPMFSRVLIKPFKQNPFQRMEVKSGIIVDAGGYSPHTELNPMTGKYEEQKEFIVTGCVVEVGPDVKYVKESDVVYYRVDTAVPVPFFKQGLVSVAENQLIAVVNEGLQKRFEKIKGVENE